MSKPLSLYLGRITPWQSTHTNFTATVSGSLEPVVTASAVIETLPAAFDLDWAIGAQLDAVGLYIKPDRNVRLPIPGAYFSLDIEGLGLDQGALKGPYDGEYGIYQLDDETYRRLLYANTLANRWDGTVPGAQAVCDTFFIDPETLVFVQDNAQVPYPLSFFSLDVTGSGLDEGVIYEGDAARPSSGSVNVSMTIGVAGKLPPRLYLGLLAQRAIRIKPSGVKTDYAVTTVDGAPLFGLDVQNDYVSGLDTGAIGADPADILSQ